MSQSLTRFEPFLRRWWPALLFAGVAFLIFWEYFLIDQTLYAGDTAFIFLPLRAYLVNRLAAGELPLWNPHLFAGTPGLAEAQYQVFYPLNLLLFLVGSHRGMGWLLPFHLVLAAVGTYLFARRSLGQDRYGAALAGLIFAFGGPMQCKLANSPYPETAAWLPWVLLAYDTARHRRGAALALPGLALAAQFVTGAPQYAYYTLVLLAAYHLWVLLQQRKEHVPGVAASAWMAFAATLLIGPLLTAGQLLPEYELALQSNRGMRPPFEYVSEFSLRGRHLLGTLLFPYLWGSFHGPASSGFFPAEEQAYLGVLALGLLVAAWMGGRSRNQVWFWTLIVVGAVLLAFGSHNLLYRLLYQFVPGFATFRAPSRWLLLAAFGGAMLAGGGLDAVLTSTRAARTAALTVAVLAVLAIVLLVTPVGSPALAVPAGMAGPMTQIFLLLGAAWLLFSLSRETEGTSALRPRIPALLLAVAALDFFTLADGMELRHTLTAASLSTPPEETRLVKEAPSEGRFWPGHVQVPLEGWQIANRAPGVTDIDARRDQAVRMRVMMPSCLPAEFGTMGLTGAWGALMPLRRHPRSLFEPTTPRAEQLHWLRLLGVRYQFSLDPLTDPSLVSLRSELPFLYRDPEAFPRAFWVANARTAGGFEEALAATTTPTFDARQAAIIEGAPAGSTGSTGSTGSIGSAAMSGGTAQRFIEYRPERVRLEADAPAPGWLVLMDTPYPGWSARVDGKPVPLYPANAVGRAVQVDTGHHEIEMRFQPASVRVGIFLSLATVSGLLILILAAPRRRFRGVSAE